MSGGALRGQQWVEWQAQGVAALTGAEFAGAGVGVALRPRGRSRFGIAASGGVDPVDGSPLGRIEATFGYLLNPWKRSGLAPYAAGGATVQAWTDRSEEFLLLVVGVESSPGGRHGWFLEVGVGGGVRASAGLRIRRARRR